MANSKFAITIELEPIVNLRCMAIDCRNSLMQSSFDRWAACNLKHVQIDDEGRCSFYEKTKEVTNA